MRQDKKNMFCGKWEVQYDKTNVYCNATYICCGKSDMY